MAKNWFHHSERGYREVMRDYHTRQECLGVAQHLAIGAEAKGGGPYVCDVIPGLNRAHARVTTERSWKAFKAEKKTKALSRSIPSQRRKRG